MYKLLVVDDEYIERRALKFVIENNCPQISEFEEAANGREAISKASTFRPDVIIIDIKMPGINGIDASKEIKRLNPGCRIVFLTAFDYFDYAQEAIKIGVEDFIIKPAPNEQVIEIVNRITDSLNMEKEQSSKQIELENKLEQVKSYLENELVYSLVSGDIEEEQIKEYLLAMGIEFKQGFGVVLRINYDSYIQKITSPLQKNMIKKRCMEKIESVLVEQGVYCLMNHVNNNIYLFIISKRDDSVENMRKLAEQYFKEVFKVLKEQLWINVNIGIGDCYKSLKQINNSFLQAKTALNSIDDKEIVHINDIKQGKQINVYPTKKEKLLCEKIVLGDEGALIVLDEILDWIDQYFDSMEDFRRKAYEIMVVINRAASQEIKSIENDASFFFKDMDLINSKRETRQYIKDMLKKVIEEVNSVRIDRAGSLIEKVREYIKQNYMKEITLDEMAGMVGLSSYYFSKIFKHYQNVNFIDYLTIVRINKAKELLADPVINIKEISGMVGYSDPNYFARVFKRIEGITPTEYRNKKMLSRQ